MSIVKAYLLPHSPILIPEIGKANYNFLDKTISAYQKIKDDLQENGIETIVIISPHSQTGDDFYIINAVPEMEISFPDFGYIAPKNIIKGDIILCDKIKNELKSEGLVRILTEKNLDYGSAIPLHLLKTADSNFKVLVISPANKIGLEDHYNFGKKLKEILNNDEKKIAIIASGDLSHRLKRKSPGGYSHKGPKFDNKLIEYLSNPESTTENILKMDKKLIVDASECGLKPIMTTLGILDGKTWDSEILAYQTDFGIGYLSLEFKFNN